MDKNNLGYEDTQMEVLLLEPMYAYIEDDIIVRETADFYSGSPIVIREPIASQYITGYLKDKGISCDVIQQSTGNDDLVFHYIKNNRPQILSVSIHSTHLFPRILSFLEKCKKLFPDIIVVCGGNHPTCAPEIINEECIDYVIRGEGEEILYQLTKLILNKEEKSVKNIKGVTFKQNDVVIHNQTADRINFSKAPWPLRKKEILDGIKCAPLCYPLPSEQNSVAQVSFSRGCPFKCEFCVSPLIFPGGTQYRDPQDIINEINHLKAKYGTNFLFFTDLTINAHPSKMIELCDQMIAKKVNINWFAYCSAHAEEELITKMAAAGCSRIGLGAESFLDEILEVYKYQQNSKLVSNTLKKINDAGILNRVYMLIGYPEETKEMLDKTLEIMKNMPIDQPRLAFITPFPGTPFYKKYENQLTTSNLEYYSGDYPIVQNENISSEEYINIRDNMIISFYNSPEYSDHIENKCINSPHLVNSFEYFIHFLKSKKILEEKNHDEISRRLKKIEPLSLKSVEGLKI